MLTTSSRWSPAYRSAAATESTKQKPSPVHALSATRVASGATPAMPIPLMGAAAIEATWVPWPYRSRMAALLVQLVASSTGAAVGVPGLMNEHERARSRLGAMSGWVGSTPLSRMPMVTPSPVAWDRADALASIRAMSHWQTASGSLLGVS